MDELCAQNTDRELYRENADQPSSYYNDSVHVTREGAIGMNVGGLVLCLPIAEWHRRALGWDAQSVHDAGLAPEAASDEAREAMYRRIREGA